ncbi:MFS transporter [Alicyclobacillus tolerans]|uniref:MFS transporter n=1 Tax=Alicyclobacillus tolerans TaxID=90970 RepID=UPI001F02E55F|nr:MFS transporter [Alicyclobacillus tolerans]MCF8568438.1 MFS transporter [Alicyclobacillus tolerans]
MKILDGHLHTLAASYPKESYVFILASLVNSVGNSLMWPLTTIYVHNVLHRTYGEAGLVLLFQSLAMVVGQFVGGALFHKLGPKRLIVGSLVLTGLAQLGLIAAKLWVPYILTMTLAGFLNAITMPAVSAFIAFRWPNEQYRLFNAVYVSNNVGVAMGTALAGVLAAISFNLTFLFNGLTTILFGAFFYAFLRRFNREETEDFALGGLAQSRESNLVSLLKPYRLYLFVALGMAMVSLATSAWNSGVAPYLNQKGLSPAVYGFLWTVNGIVILVGQPVTSLLNRYLTQSLYARLVASAVLYAAGFGFMWALHHAYVDLVLGMVVGTLGEMLISPTTPSLITQTTGRFAPFYLGLVGGVGSVGRLVGPVLFGNMFDGWGVNPIFAVSTAATVLAAGLFVLQFFLRTPPSKASSSHPLSLLS